MTRSILRSELSGATSFASPAVIFGPSSTRTLDASDEAAFAAHLKRLDERGRRLRFGAPVNDGFIDAYAQGQFRAGTHLVGLFFAGTLRGVAELCLDPLDPAHAEGAFSLEAGFRGSGLGTLLFETLLDAARRRGIRRLTLQCLRENVAMQKIARRFSGTLVFDGSEVTADIAVPAVPRPGPCAISLRAPL